MQKAKFTVIRNNKTDYQPCPLCGCRDKADSPFWVYLDADPDKPVCFFCVQSSEPRLLAAITKLNRQEREAAGEIVDTEMVDYQRQLREARRHSSMDLDAELTFKPRE